MAISGTALLLALVTLLWLLYWYLTKPNRYWEKLGIPCVSEASLWQSALDNFSNKAHEKDNQRRQKYGRVYGAFEFIKPVLFISEPALLKNIFVKDFAIFHSPRDFGVGHDISNYMLFALRGDAWKRVRSIMSPVFTTGKIKKLLPHIEDSSRTLAKNFLASAKKKEAIDVHKFFEAFAMDLIVSSAFATKIDSHNDPQNDFVLNARKVFTQSITWRFLLFTLFPRLAAALGLSIFDPEAMTFFKHVTLRIIEERKRKGEKRNDFIQLMMDSSADAADKEENSQESTGTKNEMNSDTKNSNFNNKVLSHDELLANCIMFFLVAYGSTSLTLAFLAHVLATHPDCQEKLISEVDEVLKENNNELNYDAVQRMKYLDMVVAETLRLYPVAFRSEREAQEDYKLADTGITIRKGTLIQVPIYAVHHDPELYPEPEKFNPERFSSEEKSSRDPYSYLPFSAGPRNCVGMRFALFDIKTCLVYMLSQFRFKMSSQTKVELDFVSNLMGLLQPKDVILKVEERHDKVLKNFIK